MYSSWLLPRSCRAASISCVFSACGVRLDRSVLRNILGSSSVVLGCVAAAIRHRHTAAKEPPRCSPAVGCAANPWTHPAHSSTAAATQRHSCRHMTVFVPC